MSPYRAQLPGVRVVGDSLSAVRRSTTVALAGIEIPAAFAMSTVAAEARLLLVPARERSKAQRKQLARLASKCRRLEEQ